jgi:hypothetical protein
LLGDCCLGPIEEENCGEDSRKSSRERSTAAVRFLRDHVAVTRNNGTRN